MNKKVKEEVEVEEKVIKNNNPKKGKRTIEAKDVIINITSNGEEPNWPNYKTPTYSGGPGLCTLLTVAFVVLKLTGTISWPWVWVLAPLWIGLGIAIFLVIVIAVFLLVFVDRLKKLDNELVNNQ